MVNTNTETIPRRREYRVYLEIAIENIESVGKRLPIKESIRLQEGGNKGKTLNITTHDL